MNRTQLISQIASTTGLETKDVTASIGAAIDLIVSAVAEGEAVTLSGLGTFERRERAARGGRNPRTGEPITIPASQAPAFKAATPFKTAVAGK